jgi:hypothetical protein
MAPEKPRGDGWWKRIAIGSVFVINIVNLGLAMFTRLPQILLVGIFVVSFAPYLLYLRRKGGA